MSDENLRLKIGHVLFIDIVGYSKLLIEEQKERLNQLTEIVLATAQVREASEEQLVRLPTGDGMALVFHHSAEGGIGGQCANVDRRRTAEVVLKDGAECTDRICGGVLSRDGARQLSAAYFQG